MGYFPRVHLTIEVEAKKWKLVGGIMWACLKWNTWRISPACKLISTPRPPRGLKVCFESVGENTFATLKKASIRQLNIDFLIVSMAFLSSVENESSP